VWRSRCGRRAHPDGTHRNREISEPASDFSCIIERHPKVGASWEGVLLRQVAEQLGASAEECFFWATHSGAELGLLWVRGRRRWGFEFKHTSSPKLTSSLKTAIEPLGLQKAFLVHAGDKTFQLHKQVTVVTAARLLHDVG
jgi:hypothetical protein